MTFVRTIGRWAMTGLVINCIIGSGIFGVPGELIRLLGAASPLAMVVAAFLMAVIVACAAEVASYFNQPGGAYLYVRSAFGRFAGLQVGWFWLLASVAGGAANVTLFTDYLGGLEPSVTLPLPRAMLVTVLVALPAAINYRGVRGGANLSSVLVLAKLLPLLVLIALGLPRLSQPGPAIIGNSAQGWDAWLNALVLLLFTYAGFEDALVPLGEVSEPRRAVPFALAVGLLVSATVYTSIQLVIVGTPGASGSDRPLADAAATLTNHGTLLVTMAVMISTYGWVSASLLNAPRLAYALATHGDSPAVLGKLHERFHTPATAVVTCALLMWALAITGTFLWIAALTAGSTMIVYAGICATLLRLRRIHASGPALRVPGGRILAVGGIVIVLVLLTRLQWREILLMSVTTALATANWWWAKRRASYTARAPRAVSPSN